MAATVHFQREMEGFRLVEATSNVDSIEIGIEAIGSSDGEVRTASAAGIECALIASSIGKFRAGDPLNT